MVKEQYITKYLLEMNEAIEEGDYEKFKNLSEKNFTKLHNLSIGNDEVRKEIDEVMKKARKKFLI